jgi:hypothetical protein
MKISLSTIIEQPISTPPRPRQPGLHPVRAFGITYGMIIAGVAILLREVVLRTGGNAAGGNVVVLGTLLVALVAALIVVLFARAVDAV